MSAPRQFTLLTQRRFLPFFLVQALTALNDNVFRQSFIALLIVLELPPQQRLLYTQLAPALFILPFFLFSYLAGQIAEQIEKQRLIRLTNTLEIVIMSVAAIGLLRSNLPLLLVTLFCSGVQASFFGPVKYALLPAVLTPTELTGGNGLVESGTSLAILAGMVIGGGLFVGMGAQGPQAAALTIMTLALLGNAAARCIPTIPGSNAPLSIAWNPLRESLRLIRLTHRYQAVRYAVLGISWFWFVGTVLTTQLPDYAMTQLGGRGANLYVLLLAAMSIGTGIGSLLCEKLSRQHIEIGLVPLGACGISFFLLLLELVKTKVASSHGISVVAFIQQPGSWVIIAAMICTGLFSGFLIVPLFALIQHRTPPHELARVIAALNIQNALFIVAAAVVGVVLRQTLHWTVGQVLLALVVLNTAVAVRIFWIVPEFLLRFVCWLLVSFLYRLRRREIEQIPQQGGALLVCNHVSYVDALLLTAAVSRPIRFVMHQSNYSIPILHWVFSAAKTIPIAGVREDRALMRRAFATIDTALAAGELVCIFPEGGLTCNGELGRFHSGVEHILARSPVTVVPLALCGMWSSMWSRRDSLLGRARLPRRFRAPVDIIAAAAIPPTTPVTASTLETTVRQLLHGQAEGSTLPGK